MRNLLCFIRPKTSPSRLFCGIFSRHLSKQSFVLAHQSYETKESQNEDTPVLIIHGMLGSKKNWHSFSKSYSEQTGKRVITVDCRCHGQSPSSDEMTFPLMAGDIVETLKQLNIPKAILIGHSMGGKVATETAFSVPSMVEKLILVDIYPTPALVTKMFSMVTTVLAAMLNLDLSQIKNRTDADVLLKTSIPFDDLRAWALTNLYKDRNGQFHWFVNVKSVDKNKENLFEGVGLNGRKPYEGETLFIGGEESEILRDVNMNELRKSFPKGELEMIPGAGHFVHAERPKEFLEMVKNFLR